MAVRASSPKSCNESSSFDLNFEMSSELIWIRPLFNVLPAGLPRLPLLAGPPCHYNMSRA